VTFRADLSKVATLSDGLVEEVMTHLGYIDRLSAIGSKTLSGVVESGFVGQSGSRVSYQGQDILSALHPWLKDLPRAQAMEGGILNFETFALAEPDLVIMRAGDCATGRDESRLGKTLELMESFGWPIFVLNAPGVCGPDIAGLDEEIRLLGQIFGKEAKAKELALYLSGFKDMVIGRVASLRDDQKVSMLYMGLASFIRRMSATASAMGSDAPISFVMERIIKARNAYPGPGFGVHLSAEQLLALDPDVIILSSLGGYHPPRELYEDPDFADLSELKAVKGQRVYSMPWTPDICPQRLEYPLDLLVMAKAAYPDLFSDISVYDLALGFYQKVYNIDERTAKELRSAQMLDWMAEENF
jgi:iron complex transport system substrate-binding protein